MKFKASLNHIECNSRCPVCFSDYWKMQDKIEKEREQLSELQEIHHDTCQGYNKLRAKAERLAIAIRPFARIAPELLTNRKTLSLFTEEDAIEAAVALSEWEKP